MDIHKNIEFKLSKIYMNIDKKKYIIYDSNTLDLQTTYIRNKVVFSLSSTNKTDRHDITEILLKVALKQHKINQPT